MPGFVAFAGLDRHTCWWNSVYCSGVPVELASLVASVLEVAASNGSVEGVTFFVKLECPLAAKIFG